MTWTAHCTLQEMRQLEEGGTELVLTATDEQQAPGTAGPAIVSNTEGAITDVRVQLLLAEQKDSLSLTVGQRITVNGHFSAR